MFLSILSNVLSPDEVPWVNKVIEFITEAYNPVLLIYYHDLFWLDPVTPKVIGYKTFSHNAAIILVFQKNETAATLVYQANPVRVKSFLM